MGGSRRVVNAARCKDSGLRPKKYINISTLQVCAKGPGEACGGPYNSAGKCGDGFRRGSNSLIVWMGKHEAFSLFLNANKKC